MIRKRPDSGWRALVFGAALFAVTLNFLQPLVHAALLRDGGPISLWAAFCTPAGAGVDNGSESVPASAAPEHECCLGLSHPQVLIEPLAILLLVVFASLARPSLSATEQSTRVGI